MKWTWRVLGSLAIGLALAACGEDLPPSNGTDAGTMTSTTTMGSKGFLEACTASSECMSNLCYRYNMAGVGMLCTKTCTGPADCPAPSSGCSGMGVCKHN